MNNIPSSICPLLKVAFFLMAAIAAPVLARQQADDEALFKETFDTHWENLRDNYPYFELYGVDWEAERAEHRPLALAAESVDEFAWELAKLIATLPDPHVSFVPSMTTVSERWSVPEINTVTIERRPYLMEWPRDASPAPPDPFAGDPLAYPEIVTLQGEPAVGAIAILAGGPLGTSFEIGMRWPDGQETVHEFKRPDTTNLPPPTSHLGDSWLVTGRVGPIGYMRIRTFSPEMATLGPDGKITTMLRAALAELKDTEGLVLDLQGNGGGLVAASDPFLRHLIKRTISYRWGNSGGKSRRLTPNKPHYGGRIVAIVDRRSASGGEWAARILRDADRAVVVGERTAGAEAAVLTSEGPDGSVVSYSGWPMIEPGVTSFQEVGIELDYELPLTIEDLRSFGYKAAMKRITRARLAKALEVLDRPQQDIDALMELASESDDVLGAAKK